MILLILGLALTLLSLVQSLMEKWKKKNVEDFKRKNSLALFGLFIGLIGMFMTFYSGWHSIKEKSTSDSLNIAKDKENKTISNKLLLSQEKIIELQKDQSDSLSKVLSSSLRLTDAQKKLINLQIEANKQLTGDNIIPELTFINLGNNIVSFMICNNGNYSIPDVQISMTDSYEIRKKYGTMNFELVPNISDYGKTYNIGTINKKNCNTFYKVEIPTSWNNIAYLIYVYYRSGDGYFWHVKYSRDSKKELHIVNSSYHYLHLNKKVVFPKLK